MVLIEVNDGKDTSFTWKLLTYRSLSWIGDCLIISFFSILFINVIVVLVVFKDKAFSGNNEIIDQN